MKGKKLLFLFAALLFPIAIFIFLKTFGENEFQVPVFYDDGDIATPVECGYTHQSPYLVPDTILEHLNIHPFDSVYVVFFDGSDGQAWQRVIHGFGKDPVQVVDASGPPDDLREVRDCIFLMPPNTSVALMDQRRRIRGYYDARERDEVDRLMVEIKIILRKY